MVHQEFSKGSAVSNRTSLKTKQIHKRLRFAWVVLICLFGGHLSVNHDQMIENVGTKNPSLPAGKLYYFPDLKRTGSTAPGIFMYSATGTPSTTTTQTFKFFDSEPLPGFVHDYQLSYDLGGRIDKAIYISQFAGVYFNGSFTTQGQFGGVTIVQYNTDASAFAIQNVMKISNNNLQEPSRLLLPLTSSDKKIRVLIAQPGSEVSFLELEDLRATKSVTFEATNFEYLDQVIQIGDFSLYLHRLGHLLWDDETILGNNIELQTLADFQPKYALRDLSRPCSTGGCDVIVFQERDNNKNHLSILTVKITNAPNPIGVIKFPSLDVTSFATVNMPVPMPFLNAVALAGSTKFHLFNILEDRFDEVTEFTSVSYSGIQPGSLVFGEFNPSLYPDQRPCMAMFADGATYKPRMFVLSNTRCKTKGQDGVCTECQLGQKLDTQNRCSACEDLSLKFCEIQIGGCKCEKCQSGYRIKEDVKLCEPCAVQNCETCTSAASQCEVCKPNFLLAGDICKPTGSPALPPSTSKSWAPSVSSVLTNSFGFAFPPDQSRNIHSVEVYDLNSNTNFSCLQTGCKYHWKGSLLRLSFTPSFTVTNANLVIRRKPQQTSSAANSPLAPNRLLQTLDDSDIVIPNIKLTQTPGYIGWVTVGQVVLFLFRTVGSVLTFHKYPVLAMVPDLLITMSVILCTFLGPVILTADSAFETVGQVKILWFRIGSLVEDWDTHTLSLSTAPNAWKYPIFSSFLDNYSQNTVGLLALAVLLTIAGFFARRVTQNKQSSPKLMAVASTVEKHYGTRYFLAKLYANSIEILMFSLVSFDKADASSKSIIGIMLAAVLVGVQVWLVVGATLTSSQDPGTIDPADAARPHESRPQTVIMTEENPVARNPPLQSRRAEQAVRVLTFGWQLMLSTNLKQVVRSKKFLDTAFFLRNLGICLLVLKLVSSPQAQLITAMCLQLLYVCYFAYCNNYREMIEFVAALSLEVLVLLAILLKTLSTTPSISESNLQTTLGLLLLIVLAVCMVLITGAYGLALIWIWRSQETSGLDPKSFKPCALVQPNGQPGVSTPADPQIPSTTNLKLIIEDKPTPSPRQADAGPGFSMHLIPDEGMNAQTLARAVPITEQQSE